MNVVDAPQNPLLNTRLRYDRYGSHGPGVILLHSIGLDRNSWKPIVPYLEDGYQVVAVDLPGHGESDKPSRADYRIRALAERVERLMDELGWERATLIGNSLGGGTSLALAVQHPDRVSGLVLLNSVGYRAWLPPLGWLAFTPVAPALVGAAPPPLYDLGLRLARANWRSVTPEGARACHSYLSDPVGREAFLETLRRLYGRELDELAEHYREIRCPTLVLHGARDPLILPWHAQRLAQTIPRAEYLPLGGCGHFPQEEHPEIVGPAVRRFLDRIPASARKERRTR